MYVLTVIEDNILQVKLIFVKYVLLELILYKDLLFALNVMLELIQGKAQVNVNYVLEGNILRKGPLFVYNVQQDIFHLDVDKKENKEKDKAKGYLLNHALFDLKIVIL